MKGAVELMLSELKLSLQQFTLMREHLTRFQICARTKTKELMGREIMSDKGL